MTYRIPVGAEITGVSDPLAPEGLSDSEELLHAIARILALLQRSYETMTGDRPPAQLIDWYGGCRALVRARLCAVHSLEPGAHPPAAWLDKAERYVDVALAYTDALS